MGLDFVREPVSIDSDPDSNSESLSIPFSIPKELSSGEYLVEIKAYRDNVLDSFQRVALTITCGTAPAQPQEQPEQLPEQEVQPISQISQPETEVAEGNLPILGTVDDKITGKTTATASPGIFSSLASGSGIVLIIGIVTVIIILIIASFIFLKPKE